MTDGEYRLRQWLADLLHPNGRREREQHAAELAQAHQAARRLFHHLWSQAHDYPDYKKSEWSELASLLSKLGVDF